MENHMNKEKPTYLEAIASVKIGEDKSKWTRIGVAFPLKNRPGFSLRLEFIPVPKDQAYEFILVEPKDRVEDGHEE